MSKFRSVVVLIPVAIVGLAILSGGCKKKPELPAAPMETRHVLGTDVTISVYDAGMTGQQLKPTFDAVFELMSEIEKKAITPGPENQVSKIAASAGTQSIATDGTIFDMLMKAIRLYDASGKVFDIRYGPMLDAWDFDGNPHVPASAQLDSLKSLVEDGGLFVAGNSILLAKSGMRFDVREIALGYAFDVAAGRLAELGIHSATISSPRVCRTLGNPPTPEGFPWKLADPLQPDSVWRILYVPTGGTGYATASIGHFVADGKSYNSLLDPRTGMPAEKCAAAIVQSPDAATAQALSYAVFVFGTTDSLDQQGQSSVGGSIVVRNEGGNLKTAAAGSLSGKLEAAG